MTPHLLRCQGFAVAYYGFTLGRLGSGASSTFAQLRSRLVFTLIWQQRQDQPAPDLLILKNGIYIQADPCQILNEYDNYNDHPHL
jgi:hypothetical protein